MISLSIVTCGLDYRDIEITLQSVSLFKRANPHLVIEQIVVCPVLIPSDDRIDVSIIDDGKGIYSAFNLGIVNATSDYVQILNAGDTLAEINISTIDCDVDFHLFAINAGGDLQSPRLSRIKLLGSSLPHSGMWVKRKIYSVVGLYNIDIPIVADFIWIYRNYEFIERNCKIHDTTALVNFKLDGISSKFQVIGAYFFGLKQVEKNLFKVICFTTIKFFSYIKWKILKS